MAPGCLLGKGCTAAIRACLLGALAKLPGPGSELRRPILVAWGQDRCLGGVLPGRAASKQAIRMASWRPPQVLPMADYDTFQNPASLSLVDDSNVNVLA